MAGMPLIIFFVAVSFQNCFAQQSTDSLRQAASKDAITRDWMLQDYMNIELPVDLRFEIDQWRVANIKRPESKPDAPVLEHLECFRSRIDSIVEQRMVKRVLEELGQQSQSFRTELDSLVRDQAVGADPRWKDLYLRACRARRDLRLRPLLARWNRFVFSEHKHVPGSWKYTEGLSAAHRYRFFSPSAAICELQMQGSYGLVRPVVEDRGGMIRNPDISYDGKRLLFAWKKSDRGDDYHIYEMHLESKEIRQLTEGRNIADYEGIYLPDGNILFNSTRCFQSVDCNWVEVSNFYLMDGDGDFIRRVCFDQVHTIFPTVADDGRIFYTRWEYNDRAQIYPQPLFQMNPDGTNQREFYGGNSWFPTNIIHARKIEGTNKVLAIITGHHRPAHGKVAIIDPSLGRQEGKGVQLVAPPRHTDPIVVDHYGEGGNQFQYPYPLDEQHFLTTLALPNPTDGKLGRFNIYFMDVDGRRELLVEGREQGQGVGCRQIIPLAPRKRPFLRPSMVDYRRTDGSFFVQNVYEGLAVEGVEPGTIKRLRVVALKYRAASIGATQQKGKGGSSSVMTPIAIGNGSWDVKVVLGSTPVYEDGSAMFVAPARMPLYFQALDENDRVVQTMRSWTTLMPGENQSCVGCHEHKNSTPRSEQSVSLAMQAGPLPMEPFYGPARGFSYPTEIQPILDRHCIECHDGRDDVPLNLTGELVSLPRIKRRFSKSYLALTHTKGCNGDWNHPLVNWIDCMSEPAPLPPYHRGSAMSGLMKLLDDGHEKIKLSREEKEKLACWIDLLVPYCGDYYEGNTWSSSDRARYDRIAGRRAALEQQEAVDIERMLNERNSPSGE